MFRVLTVLFSVLLGQRAVGNDSFPEVNDVVGDVPSLSSKKGFWVNPYTNDVFGWTDKINTHSASVGYVGVFRSLSFQTSAHWRLVTPIYKVNRTAKPLQAPIGKYADWAELKPSVLKKHESFVFQGHLSLSHIGDKGGKEIQNTSHAIWGVDRRLSWDEQEEAVFVGYGGSGGWEEDFDAVGVQFNTRISAGYSHSFLSEELYTRGRIRLASLHEDGVVELASSLKLSHVLSSQLGAVKPFRVNGALKLHLWGWWRPSLSLSTPFLEGDSSAQLHGSPFDVFIEL